MFDSKTADHWGTTPGFTGQLCRWTWFREAFLQLLPQVAQPEQAGTVAAASTQELADAFWRWMSVLDAYRTYEPLDPEDFAHYAAGMLLAFLIHARKTKESYVAHRARVRTLTRAALTVLAAWRLALGARPLEVNGVDEQSVHWLSFIENVAENPYTAVAFLDFFTHKEPVWQFPTLLIDRPPFQRALDRKRVNNCALASGAKHLAR